MKFFIALFLAFMVSTPVVHAQSPDDTPQDLIARYQAINLSKDFIQLARNPWKFQGHQVYVTGLYFRHLNQSQVLMLVKPGFPVVWEVDVDLPNGVFIGCVGEVLGTVRIETYQHVQAGEAPHLQVLECVDDPFQFAAAFLDRIAATDFGAHAAPYSAFEELLFERLSIYNRTTPEAQTGNPTQRSTP